MRARSSPVTLLDSGPLREYGVLQKPLSFGLVRRLQAYLNAAINETPLQRFLEKNPLVLGQHLAGGHGGWVIPGSRLGSQLVPDFVIGEHHGGRCRWTIVELESPSVRLFTRDGDATRPLQHGIGRIRGWRAWLHDHGSYARAQLSLADISGNAHALILIGRRARLRPEDARRRRQLEAEEKVAIHTYDWLLDGANETHTEPGGR